MSAEREQNVKGRKTLKILKIAVIVFIIIVGSELIMGKTEIDNFYTLAAIPVGNYPRNYDTLSVSDKYTIVKNYRGKPIFRHPTAAFNEMKKRCAPVINDMRKKYKLPAFSPRTYRRYVRLLGYPPGYINLPGYKYYESDGMAYEISFNSGIYENSTQLLFAPEKNSWAS